MNRKDPFNDFIFQHSGDCLVVQPRMGFSDIATMRKGLEAVRDLNFPTIGTITVDAMTRQGLVKKARQAVKRGDKLNGFPLASYAAADIKILLSSVVSDQFPVQVRHGTPLPNHVFDAARDARLIAIEGGPVSYALPYGKTLLRDTFSAWRESVTLWVEYGIEMGIDTHIESFAGCMMGQLCPPQLLIALNILEGLFFKSLGLRSLSLSMAQGTNSDQDVAALLALRVLANNYLSGVSKHIVAYTWMGVFPETSHGAELLIKESARVACIGGAERLIVKTVDEAKGIPSIENNVQSMKWCHDVSSAFRNCSPSAIQNTLSSRLAEESQLIINTVLSKHPDISIAIQQAFAEGVLDIPFCSHRDNANRSRPALNQQGFISWADPGNIPVSGSSRNVSALTLTSNGLLKALRFNKEKYDKLSNANPKKALDQKLLDEAALRRKASGSGQS